MVQLRKCLLYDNLLWCLGGMAVVISVTKEGVKFSTRGDIGSANIVCRQNKTVDKVFTIYYVLMFSFYLGSISIFLIFSFYFEM